MSKQPDIGSLRETFLANQLQNVGIEFTVPKKGDFYADGHVIEVGGKSKKATQVKDVDNYIIASDEIETGFGRKVPLWLFGFMY